VCAQGVPIAFVQLIHDLKKEKEKLLASTNTANGTKRVLYSTKRALYSTKRDLHSARRAQQISKNTRKGFSLPPTMQLAPKKPCILSKEPYAYSKSPVF